tara:strand:- start:6112 stop:6330 length:219 start_codon:yes stop_codon:yes gene_type:complete
MVYLHIQSFKHARQRSDEVRIPDDSDGIDQPDAMRPGLDHHIAQLEVAMAKTRTGQRRRMGPQTTGRLTTGC